MAGLCIQLHHLSLACTIRVSRSKRCVYAISCVARIRKKHEASACRAGRRDKTSVIDRGRRTVLVVVKSEGQYANALTTARVLNEDQFSVRLAIKYEITGRVNGQRIRVGENYRDHGVECRIWGPTDGGCNVQCLGIASKDRSNVERRTVGV